MEWMRIAIKKAKSMIQKAQENMAYYYNQRKTPAPMFNLGDKIFLDASDIKITHPSAKLLHWRLRPFTIEQQVGSMAYWLKLSLVMKKLHPVFNTVKLSATLNNPILGQRPNSLPPLIIVDGDEEWKVEEILDSC